MFILTAIATGLGIGGPLGAAIATIAGASVTTGSAIGSVAGAGVGLIAGLTEAIDDIEDAFY